jgi:O-antigen ligase
LLLVAVVNSADRLRAFLSCLVVIVAALGLLAWLSVQGLFEIIPAASVEYREYNPLTGAQLHLVRLQGVGYFSDSNELGVLLGAAIILVLYLMDIHGAGRVRWLLWPVLAMLGYLLAMTVSRGAFLALVVGLGVLFPVRYGWRKAICLAGAIFPALLLFFNERQTDLSLRHGTGLERVELWAEGLKLFRQAPLLGIGVSRYEQEVGLVAHNSFIHCYVELGLLGGTFFLGALLCSFWTLGRSAHVTLPQDPPVQKLRPYLLALLCVHAVGLCSLSRAYSAPTYTFLALAVAWSRLAAGCEPLPVLRTDGRLAWRLALASGTALVAIALFVDLIA